MAEHDQDGPRDGPATSRDRTIDQSRQPPGEPPLEHELRTGPAEDRYELGPPLGAGGMATVSVATDRRLNREVAIKRLHPELLAVETAIERFFDEAEIMAELDHPGALPVYDAGRLAEGEAFYAMKRVRGRTFKDLLADRTPVRHADDHEIRHLVDLFERVCQTVAAAHAKGIIHRDLKPENVMVDEFGAVYVVDWGLAKRLPTAEGRGTDSRRTRLGAVMGTPAYMAPEQAAGQAATSDCQSDVFSLGVMLYEILTGTNPFMSDSARESMKGVQFHNPDPPRTVNPRAGRNLSAVCMKALEKDPFRRYRSAVELAEDLRRDAESLPVSAIRPRPVDRLAAWSRRRPRLAAASATLIAVTLLALTVAGYQLTMERRLLGDAYAGIDELQAEIAAAQGRLDGVAAELATADDPERIERLQREARRITAKVDAQRDILQAMALAVMGITVLSPEERAQAIVREQLLVNVDELVERGDLEGAREKIQVALRGYNHRNILGLGRAEYQRLEATLAHIQADLDAAATTPR